MTTQLKILLLGARGRLGQRIAQKLIEKNIPFVPVERVHTESFENFDKFVANMCVGPAVKPRDDNATPRDDNATPRDDNATPRDDNATPRDESENTRLLILDVSLAQVTQQVAEYLNTIYTSSQKTHHKIYGAVIGTTGHSSECQQALKTLSTHLPICVAPNFSKGIFLFSKLLATPLMNGQNLASFAQKLGFSIGFKDVHHQHKKDSPSGTALWLNKWLHLAPEAIESIRTGEVIGEHSVTLNSPNETFILEHKVTSRDVFADGACDLSTHFFEKNLPSGIYSPSDVW